MIMDHFGFPAFCIKDYQHHRDADQDHKAHHQETLVVAHQRLLFKWLFSCSGLFLETNRQKRVTRSLSQ